MRPRNNSINPGFGLGPAGDPGREPAAGAVASRQVDTQPCRDGDGRPLSYVRRTGRAQACSGPYPRRLPAAANGRKSAIAIPTVNANRRNAAIQHALPWLVPGTLAFAIIGVILAVRVSRVLRTYQIVAWLLVVSAAIVIFATLAPLYGVFEPSATGPGRCDMSNISMISLDDLTSPSDRALNVILFVPLGIAIGLLPGSRWKALLAVAAMAAPFVIETTQLLVPALNRGCQAIDVIDNLTGLAIGMILGTSVGVLMKRLPWARHPGDPVPGHRSPGAEAMSDDRDVSTRRG